MIITCSNCKKQFKINPSLIPAEGRDLKCGSCDHIWFYKMDEKKSVIIEKKTEHIIEKKKLSSQSSIDDKNDKNDSKIPEKQISTENGIKENTSSKFFSYLVVSVISFVSLIILVDTLKIFLIGIFPGLEIILFNLFEILIDIKLFIIDLY